MINIPITLMPGLLVVFNPSTEKRRRSLTVPLYYTGLTKTARISLPSDDSSYSQVTLSRDYKVNIKIEINPNSLQYFVIKDL